MLSAAVIHHVAGVRCIRVTVKRQSAPHACCPAFEVACNNYADCCRLFDVLGAMQFHPYGAVQDGFTGMYLFLVR